MEGGLGLSKSTMSCLGKGVGESEDPCWATLYSGSMASRELPGGSLLLDQERHLPGAGEGGRETRKTTFGLQRILDQCDWVIIICNETQFIKRPKNSIILFCQPTPLNQSVAGCFQN